MDLINKGLLEWLRRKNRGNAKLSKSINKLISDFEQYDWDSPFELKQSRPDADCVHSKGFYFFNLDVHRTMILVRFNKEDKQAEVVWVGSHQDYDKMFRNNKNTIKKWLRNNEWI